MRLFIRNSSGRQLYNVHGAVETWDHEMVTVQTTGSINAQAICELARSIDEKYSGESITLVLDNARYQRNRQLTELEAKLGIELLYLPNYSPNIQ